MPSSYSSAVVTSFGQMAVAGVVQVLMVPLYLHHLGTYRFGVLMMMLSGVNLVAIGVTWVSGGALRLFGERYASGDEEGFARLYAVGKWLLTAYGTLVGVAGVLAVELLVRTGTLVPPGQREDVRWGMLGLAAYLAASYFLATDRVALTARSEQAAANVLSILAQCAFVAAAVPILFVGGGLGALMFAFAGGAVLASGAARWRWRRLGLHLPVFRWPEAADRSVVRSLGGRMGMAYLVYGALALLVQADLIILGWFAGPEVVAEFAVVWRVAEFMVVALWRLPEAMQPYIVQMDSRGETERLAGYFRTAYRRMCPLALASGAAYALAGPTLLRWWVGAEHAPDGRLVYVLAGGAVLWLASTRVPVVFAYATVRLRGMTVLMGGEALAKAVLIGLLVPRVGFVAPLLAVNLFHLLGGAIAYAVLGRAAALPRSAPRKGGS